MRDNQDNDVLGELSAEEMAQLNALRQAAHDYVFQIGQLEVRKRQLLDLLGNTESRAQAILDQAAKRLGIPDGQAWVADSSGKVRLQKPSGA